MYRSLIPLWTLIFAFACSSLFADSFPSVEVAVGWRRDNIHWKMKDLDSSYISGHAHSDIHFKDIDSYTLSGKAKWVDTDYYIRFSAEYGLSDKGRAHEKFNIASPYLFHPLEVHTSDRIKRRSEVYDFDGAVGYPFTFDCCRFYIVPLVGFSWHRQHIRVKEREHSSSSSSCSFPDCYDSYSSSSEFFRSHSSSSFFLSASNPFRRNPSSDPFGSSDSPRIASALGLKNHHRTNAYRFTWYGFYVGADVAYALDPNWTLFSEFEYHFYDHAHRKRKSWTGVHFVDNHHKEGWAYGYNAVVGLTYYICNCWYGVASVDYRYWRSPEKHDQIEWKMVGCKLGIGYMY